MTTTDELRAALRTVEPAWAPPVAGDVRRRARRVRRNRRLAAATGVCAVVVAAAVGTPLALRAPASPPAADTAMPGKAVPAPAAAPDPVPGTVADAEKVRFTLRTAPLPPVEAPVPPAEVGWRGFQVDLKPGPRAGQACVSSPTWASTCSPLRRDTDGWLAVWRMGGQNAADAPVFGVLEAPVAGAVASADGKPAPAKLTPLGTKYVVVVATVPTEPGYGGITARVKLHVFDLDGRRIARYDN
jgi:hypothetical protein